MRSKEHTVEAVGGVEYTLEGATVAELAADLRRIADDLESFNRAHQSQNNKVDLPLSEVHIHNSKISISFGGWVFNGL